MATTQPPTPSVTLCRGCCCGTSTKHPDTDHAGQVERLQRAVGVEQVRIVPDCLGSCERSNVVVVTPSSIGRLFGGRPTWVGGVLDDDRMDDLTDWIRAGGPGLAAPSPQLSQRIFHRPHAAGAG